MLSNARRLSAQARLEVALVMLRADADRQAAEHDLQEGTARAAGEAEARAVRSRAAELGATVAGLRTSLEAILLQQKHGAAAVQDIPEGRWRAWPRWRPQP